MTFRDFTEFTINNMEGGYYHPNMLLDGRVTDQRYATSGETMFGIDRRNGGNINTSESGIKFWTLIDNANAKDEWRWNYYGGNLKEQLIDLVAEIMQPLYMYFANKYLTTESINIMNKDNRLVFHFVYATWNGAWWFRYFAGIFNKAVASGIKDTNQLTDIVVNSRINNVDMYGKNNSLIAQGGRKIKIIIIPLSPDYKKKER